MNAGQERRRREASRGALARGVVLPVASLAALVACGARGEQRGAGEASTSASISAARAPASAEEGRMGAGPPGERGDVRWVRPEPLVPPSGQPGVRAWVAASSSAVETQAWAILEGRTPQGGLPGETHDPALEHRPSFIEAGSNGRTSSRAPQVRMGAIKVKGKLPPEVIQRTVRQNFGRFRLCYEDGLKASPGLTGGITVQFTIDPNGVVQGLQKQGDDLANAAVSACVVRAFSGMSFPETGGGPVVVVYPIQFAPGR